MKLELVLISLITRKEKLVQVEGSMICYRMKLIRLSLTYRWWRMGGKQVRIRFRRL